MDSLSYDSLLLMSTSNKLADKQHLAAFSVYLETCLINVIKIFTAVSQVHWHICYAESVAVKLFSSNTYFSLFGHELPWEIKFSKRIISFVPFVFAM